MRKIIPLILLALPGLPVFSQAIVNVIFVGDNGITENVKEATSFIVIKEYPNSFQRLDYGLGRPVQKVRHYSDTALQVLNGAYYEYSFNGALTLSGHYKDNKKEKEWYYYNDTGKVILEQKYERGMLVKTINPDTVKKPENIVPNKSDIEARYKRGDKDWREYVIRNLKRDVAEKSIRGGAVRVGFTVNTEGRCVEVYLRRSVEFVLDEEAIRLIEASPLWHPAIQEGKKVNAYRIQPITFLVE